MGGLKHCCTINRDLRELAEESACFTLKINDISSIFHTTLRIEDFKNPETMAHFGCRREIFLGNFSATDNFAHGYIKWSEKRGRRY